MKYGKVTTNGYILGILALDDQAYYKVERKNLASQVIEDDIVEFEDHHQTAIIHKIISRRSQPFIGIVSKITPKFIYLHLPLLNPFSSIPCNYSQNSIPLLGEKVLGHILLEKINLIQSYENDRQLLSDYYIHLNLQDLNLHIQSNPISDTANVKDLTHLETFHIDPSGCQDIDDFMSIDRENKRIYIHIVDTTRYIPLNSKEDLEERKMGYTWYFPDFSIHLHSVDKIFTSRELYCLTMEIQLDDLLEIQNIEFYPSKIKWKYDFIYEEIQDIFDEKSNHILEKDLLWSLEIIQKYLPNPSNYRKKVWFNNTIEFQDELLAHRYVSAWMIFYNSWIGEKFQVPQRFHPETTILQKSELEQHLPKEVQHILYIKQMRQADYRNEGGHYGLNRKYYTHSTSPLRRYFDRIIQNICLGVLKDVPQSILEHLNRMERISERVGEWYEKQMTYKYVEQNPDSIWECYVVKKHFNGIEIYIYGLQEFIFHFGSSNKNVGDKIEIRLSIDKMNGINKLKIDDFIN
jgi:exoribonuclease R